MSGNFDAWTRRIVACVVGGVMAVSMFAVPAYRGWQTKTLLDGSQITVRQMGDEFFHYWETEEGKQAFEQADGTFAVTGEAVPTRAQARAKRAASAMQSSKPRKAIGERNLAPRGLLVLVQFSDVTFKSANNNAAFNDMLNKAGYDYNGATGSAVDYFHAQSNNAYDPTFDVVGPVTLSHNLEYYGEQGKINGSMENDMYIADFVIDAVTAAEAAGCDFSKYDSNNDGYVDIVYFIYAGKGQANGGTSETIWPHNWELISALYYEQTHGESGYYVNANTSGYITSMNIPTFDGKKINNYACSAELRGDGNRSGIGTFCHEFSHVLGLPDYYDADGEDNGENTQTPQEWSIMDYGSYNNNEMTPPNYSIYDKYFMGWATPKFLAKDAQKDVTVTTGYNDAYQITGGSSLVDYTNTGTVYYLENRQKSGWDAYLPGHGLLVWQVKYSSSVWENNAPNNTSGNARYTIVPADGKTSNYGYSSDTYPGTSNKRSYTPKTGCALTQISETDGVITFKYNGGEVNYWTYGIEGEHCAVPADGNVDKGAALNLTITPDAGYTLADDECWLVEMGSDLLEYGTGFTYNESNGAFTISNVTGNVYIVVTAKAIPTTITWMANGSTFTTTNATGTITLPGSEPTPCDGKVFVGWCATENYSSETTAPTFVQNGDAVSESTTFYAVFATQGEGGTIQKMIYLDKDSVSASYGTDTEVTRCGITCYYTNVMNNATIQMKKSGSYIANKDALTQIDSIIIDGVTDLTVYAGTSAKPSSATISGSNGKYDFSKGNYTYFKITNANSTVRNAEFIKVYYSTGGGSSYSDYTTTCAAPINTTYTIRFFDNGTQEGETQVVKQGQTAEVPTDPEPACAAYSFVGWSASEVTEATTTQPTLVTNFTATKDQDYYAIYSKTEEGEGSSAFDGQTAGTFKIYADVSGTKYYATGSVSSGKLESTTSEAEASDYIFEKVTNGFAIKFDNLYITYTGSKTNLGTSSDAYTWSIEAGSAGSWRVNSGTSGRALAFSTGGKFGGYSTGNIGQTVQEATYYDVEIGREGPVSTTYYTSSVSCGATAIENTTTDEPAAVKALMDGQIVIIRGEAVYSITGVRIK